MSEWQEVGAAKAPQKHEVDTGEVLDIPAPDSNPQYKQVVSELRKWHGELLEMERDGRLNNAADNPTLLGDYLSKLRLNVNMLFSYWNNHIEVLNDLQKAVAGKRHRLFEERLAMPKGSPNSAEQYAREMTRIDEMNVKQVENRIQQIKNEYERFNGICIYLQSKMKENNTERIMG